MMNVPLAPMPLIGSELMPPTAMTPGKRFRRSSKLLIKLREAPLVRRLFRVRHGYRRHGDRAFRLKAGIHFQQTLETSAQQAGADQQHKS